MTDAAANVYIRFLASIPGASRAPLKRLGQVVSFWPSGFSRRKPGSVEESMSERPRLSQRGQIFVSLAAAAKFAEARRLRIEEARRELTEIMLDAREQSVDGDRIKCRARSRSTQLDITAQIVQEGRLLVVISVDARDYR